MKKVSLFILVVLMLFAFVACNPNSSSSSSADDALLPGEVTPPAESERKSMSEDEITKVDEYLEGIYSSNWKDTEVVSEYKIEIDFGESGTLSIESNEDWKDSLKEGDIAETVTANGKITVGSDLYVVDNLELVGKVKSTSTHAGGYDYAIEKGSITENGTAMKAGDAYSLLLNSPYKFLEDDKCKAYSRSEKEQTKMNLIGDDGKTIGSGTDVEIRTRTKDENEGVYVYDLTIDGSRIQAKMTFSGEAEMSIDYAALDGSFFDKASCDKLMNLLNN